MNILVTGRDGQLARSLAAISSNDIRYLTLGRPELDVARAETVAQAIARFRPAAIVNAAAFTAVDEAEGAQDQAFSVNRDGARNVAAAAAEAGLPVIHISTDYVFAGDKPEPYCEDDPTEPKTVYGRSKLAGEDAVAKANRDHVILRTAWVYGPYGSNFVKTMLRLAKDRDVVRVVADQFGTPTYAPDIATGIDAVVGRIVAAPGSSAWRGTFHMVAGGETSWAGFATAIFEESSRCGGPTAKVEEIASADYPTPARRPSNSRLATDKFHLTFSHALPPWRDGLRRCLTTLSAT